MQNQSSRGALPDGKCSVDVLGTSGGVSVHGCDFNKVAKQLCWDRTSVLVFSCGFTSFLGASTLENTSGGLLLYGVCNNVTNASTFSSTVTGDTFKINYSLNCDDKCLIYLMTCKQCNKQYTGETTHLFRNIWNSYKDNARKFDRKESCMQEHLYKHFQKEGHKGFLNEVSVTFIDKTDGKDPKKRYWMRTLKTMEPYGLTIADSV